MVCATCVQKTSWNTVAPQMCIRDRLYDVLVAFRDNDPNGNGQKDEIPYCVVGKDYPHRCLLYTSRCV